MARLAIVKDGIVVNVIEADSSDAYAGDGTIVSGELCGGVGWSYDGRAFSPPPSPPAAPQPIIPGDIFLDRLTDAEYANVMARAEARDASGMLVDASLARWIEMLRMRGMLDVAGSTAQKAKAGLIARGVFTPERADIVFAPR